MTEKITWYKEVLDLEPNSKVFFPLARLLVEAQRPDEAVAVLEQGLARHDEFLEARIFLIELLYKAGERAACEKQVAKLSKMFTAYAGFWQAWAASLAVTGPVPDTATVMGFLALNFARGPITLQEVMEKGIRHLLAQDMQQDALQGQATQDMDRLVAVPEQAKESEQINEIEKAQAPEEALPAPGIAAPAPFTDEASAVRTERHKGEEREEREERYEDEERNENEERDEGEERFSLRTRSMAEILAEQGDIRGALDIYHELAAVATAPEESADLRQRIATLHARLGNAPGEEPVQENAAPEAASGKNRLIDMLAALAERVEARAHN